MHTKQTRLYRLPRCRVVLLQLASPLNCLVAITPQPNLLVPVLVTFVIEQRPPTISSPMVTPQAPKDIFRSLTNPGLGLINCNSNPKSPASPPPTGFRLGPRPLSKLEAQNILAGPREGWVLRDSLPPENLASLLNRSAIQRNHRWIASRAGSGSSSDIPLIRHASNSYVAAHHRATDTERQWQQHIGGWFSCDDNEEQVILDDSPLSLQSPQVSSGTRIAPIRNRCSLTTSPKPVQPAQRNAAGAKGTTSAFASWVSFSP